MGQLLPGTPATSLGLWDPQGVGLGALGCTPGVLFLPANLRCRADLQAGKPQEAWPSQGTVRPLTQRWVPNTDHRLIPLCGGGEEEQKGQPLGFGIGDSWLCSFSGTYWSGLGRGTSAPEGPVPILIHSICYHQSLWFLQPPRASGTSVSRVGEAQALGPGGKRTAGYL